MNAPPILCTHCRAELHRPEGKRLLECLACAVRAAERKIMSDAWAPLDAVLADAAAALAAGDEDKAMRLVDAAVELEKAIRGHTASAGIKQQVLGATNE